MLPSFPSKVSFIFSGDVNEKYNVDISNKTKKVLPDGRRLVIFKRCKNQGYLYSKQLEKEEMILKLLESRISDLSNVDHVKFVGVSEVIYSSESNSENIYSIKGYISEPILGKQLSVDYLLTLNNRDLYKVFGYLITFFKDYYIPFEYIYMDDSFNFYINIWDKKFELKRVRKSKSMMFVLPDSS